MTPLQTQTVVSLIVLEVYKRDVLTLLTEDQTAVQEFNWQRQMRYYMEESFGEEDTVVLRVVNVPEKRRSTARLFLRRRRFSEEQSRYGQLLKRDLAFHRFRRLMSNGYFESGAT